MSRNDNKVVKKSIGLNAIFNGIKTVSSIIFPLITYPYISRVLKVENLGRYNFSHSIVEYFSLFSALGISTYSIREGAKYKQSRSMISKFSSEVFTINLFSTTLSYLVLFFLLLASNKLQDYASIILVLSISIAFTTLGCEWIYAIYEEYLYIAIRTIIFQVISLILLFVFVRTSDDLIKYAVVTVISASGANFINMLGLKKYVDIKPCLNKAIFVHITPILILFANSVATKIYVSSDITVLGFLTSDYIVGIYTIASKIYSVVKQVLSAVIIVSIPRLSLLCAQNRSDEYYQLTNKILNTLIILVVPMTVGLFSLSREVILIISTEEFLDALIPLRILCFALIFCLFNWFYTSCVLIPNKREKNVLVATSISAGVNIVLNFVLIPYFGASAAAITTLIAEACSLMICVCYSKNLVKPTINLKDILSVIIGSAYVFAICYFFRQHVSGPILCAVLSFFSSIFGYMVILLALKNQIMMASGKEIKKHFMK